MLEEEKMLSWQEPAVVRWVLHRSERIRTYNFPQGRVSDHRINLTLHKLDSILEGDLKEIIEALIAHDQAERMKQVE